MNIDNILSATNKTAQHLEAIEAKLFDVVKLQLHPNLDGFNSPQSFGIYKGTGGNALGVMGSTFEPMQPKEFLASIINTVHECSVDLDLETLEFNEYSGGEMIEFSLNLAPTYFKNRAGKDDLTENKLLFTTSFNGKKSNQISLYTYRQICTNGMMGYALDTALKGKNTIGGKAKILTYCSEVSKIATESITFAEKLKALDKLEIKQAQIDAFMLKLLGYNAQTLKAGDKPETKKVNILDRINESVALEFSRTGTTAFGLLNGITHYTNHVANNSKDISDNEFIRFNNGFKLNNDAQRLLFAELN